MTRLMNYDGVVSSPTRPENMDATFVGPTSTGTVTVITSMPSTVNGGSSFNASGTVKTAGGTAITGGTVQMQYLNGSTWTPMGAAAAVSAGAFTIAAGSLTETATRSWRAVFSGSGANLASTSATKTVTRLELTTFVKTYSCNGSASYSGSGSKRTDTTNIYQGYYSSTWDEQRSVACFPTTIQTDLAGAYDITKVEVYLNCLHWGPGDGGTARIRTINNTTPPSTWGGVNNISAYDGTAWTTKTGAKWCDISALKGVPADWQSGGTKKGIALWAGSTSNEYYGYFDGVGSGEPQLRITYRKYA